MHNTLSMTDAASLVGAPEAAAIIGVTKSTLTRWVQRGRLTPVIKLNGLRGAYLFDRADIEALAGEKAA